MTDHVWNKEPSGGTLSMHDHHTCERCGIRVRTKSGELPEWAWRKMAKDGPHMYFPDCDDQLAFEIQSS